MREFTPSVMRWLYFDTEARIPGEKISYASNQRLPEDIRVRESVEVPAGFHPRHCESRKTYEYRIINDEFPDSYRKTAFMRTFYLCAS